MRGRFSGRCCSAITNSDGRLTYAGRVGTGINQGELERLWRRLQPLAISKMPLDVPPPRSTRFGSPLVLSRVHWVQPELVAEVKFLTWTEDNLLRQIVYEGLARRQAGHGGPARGAASKNRWRREKPATVLSCGGRRRYNLRINGFRSLPAGGLNAKSAPERDCRY